MLFCYQAVDKELLQKLNFLEYLESIFQEAMLKLQGNVDASLDAMEELQKLGYIDKNYNLEEFEKKLIQQGIIKKKSSQINQAGESGVFLPTKFSLSKLGILKLREHVFKEIFSNYKKSSLGNHPLPINGNQNSEIGEIKRKFEFGDNLDNIDLNSSLLNNIIQQGNFNLNLEERDLEVYENIFVTNMAIVLLIDISHSMVLYGEDRITPAKKLALSLVHLITTKFPKDDLSVVLFGDDAVEVKLSDVHKIDVGPYHTNTQMGLRKARNILLKKKPINKQIIMITDGKPSMIKLSDDRYYKNSFGLDPEIVSRTLDEAILCRKRNIQMTTFMIADDPTLKQFINKLTKVSKGKAFYSNLDNLGKLVIENFLQNKKKHLRW